MPMLPMAQVDEALEQWVSETDDETAAAAFADELAEVASARPNLNDTSTLASLPLLTPFQTKALKNYITLYGQLLSHKELGFIPGFDSSTIEMLERVTTVEPYTQMKRLKLSEGHHSMILGLGSTLERAAGYDDGRYDGDPLHAQMTYSYDLHNRINVRLVADKDPTEAWGRGNYYGYHLMLRNFGRVERLIVGRYNLQLGQGLTMWSGLRPFNLLGATPQRTARGISAASTFYEEGYMEGAATMVRVAKDWRTTAFLSRVHGTNMLGGHVEYRHGNLIAGLTANGTLLDSTATPTERIYNQHAFRGRRMMNIGADALWQWRNLLLYGEAAMCDSGGAAAIAGARLMVDSRNSLGISFRNYGKRYHSLAAQPYAIGDGSGESGWTLDAKARLPLKIDALLSADLHSFASLRYGSYRPSTGAWLRAQLSRSFGRHTTASLRYTYRQKERNIPYSTANTYEHESTLRQQLQATLHNECGSWTFDTRATAVFFESSGSGNQKGWALAQQARYTHRKWQATAAVCLFDADGYYARIYVNESYMMYNFTMPALYGQGIRASVLLRHSIGESLALGAKYAITHYLDRENVGSGAAKTEGPNRQTLYLQLQWKF